MKQAFTVAILLVALTLGGCRDWFYPTPPDNPDPNPNKPTKLQDVEWCLISFEFEDGTVSPVEESKLVDGMRPSAYFSADGQVSGNTGCNSYGGPYTLSGGTNTELNIGSMIHTDRACPGSYEGLFFAALSTTKWYEITDDGILRLYHSAAPVNGALMGNGVLNFERCAER